MSHTTLFNVSEHRLKRSHTFFFSERPYINSHLYKDVVLATFVIALKMNLTNTAQDNKNYRFHGPNFADILTLLFIMERIMEKISLFGCTELTTQR